MNYNKKILNFFKHLKIDANLPQGIEVMNPYNQHDIFGYCTLFYNMFYNNDDQRSIILGINPGRFGAGLTGIPFTDPMKLEQECGIENELPKKRELSADFIYQMINAYGGKEAFYSQYYFGSVSPLGFTRDGKNLNYYDDPKLQKAVLPFILESLNKQLDFGLNKKVAYCLGEGKNYKFLTALNKHHQFFHQIIPLAHPRFIMQYKRKKVDAYIGDYLNKLNYPSSFTP